MISETDPLGNTKYFGYNRKNGEVPPGQNGEKFSWGELGIQTLAGAASGAIGAVSLTGVALVTGTNALIDVVAEAGVQKVRYGAVDSSRLMNTAITSVISTGISLKIDSAITKYAGRLYPTRYKTDTSIFRPTQDAAFADLLYIAKNRKTYSIEWEYTQVELIQQLFYRSSRMYVDSLMKGELEKGVTRLPLALNFMYEQYINNIEQIHKHLSNSKFIVYSC